MKKNIWLFLLLFLPWKFFPVSLSYVAGGEVKDLEKEKEERKISWNGGFKGSVSLLEGCFYTKDRSYSYGLSLKSPKIDFGTEEKTGSFSAELKGGMVTKSGFVSFLANPALSSVVSPFSSDERTFSILSASLPSISSSFSTRHSGFLETGLVYGNWDFSSSFFYCPFRKEMNRNSSLVAGAFETTWTPGWKSFPKLKISLGQLYENAGYEEKKSDSWYEKNSFYRGGRSSSGLLSFRIGTGPYGGKPEFWLYFHSLLFQNPFGKVNNAFRGNLVFGYGGFAFVSEAFYNPQTGLFTAEGKTLDPEISAKGSVSQKFVFGKKKTLCLQAGFSGFWKENLLYLEDQLKLSGGLKLSFWKTTVTFTAKNDWETVEVKKAGLTETKLNPVTFSAGGNVSLGLDYFTMETSASWSKAYEKERGEWKAALSAEGGVSQIKAQVKMETAFSKEKLKSLDLSFSVSGRLQDFRLHS